MKKAAFVVVLVWISVYAMTAVKAASAANTVASQYNQQIEKATSGE